MRAPLTAELLAKRSVVLFTRLRAAHGDTIEGTAFDRLLCDGCGRMVDLTVEPHPKGWTTSGDFRQGFRDLCPECSP